MRMRGTEGKRAECKTDEMRRETGKTGIKKEMEHKKARYNSGNVRGSMTVFAALSIMLVASFLFVLLEAAHQQQLRRVAQMNTSLVVESVFSNYCSPLWEKYQILALDNGMTEEQEPFVPWEYYAADLSKESLSQRGFMRGANHLRMDTKRAEFVAYRMLTDEDGRAYIKTISDYMRNTIGQQAIEKLAAEYQQLSGMDISDKPDDTALAGADNAIAEARRLEEEKAKKAEEERKKAQEAAKKAKADKKTEATKNAGKKAGTKAAEDTKKAEKETSKSKEKTKKQESGVKTQAIELAENPLEIIKNLWHQGTLSLVLKDAKAVSNMKEDGSDAVSKREKYTGIGLEPIQTDATDTLLFTEYLLDHFACYTSGEAAGMLAYELEYLLCGNEKDQSNLSETVQRLLAVREAANLAYLAADASKQELAYSVALSLAGVTANPGIIYAVKCGLLAAWALAESVLDVRALLSGDKIAIIKNSAQWTSDLLHLGSVFSSFGTATNCQNGLSYQRYLGFLLMMQAQKVSYRAMNIQEHVIRSKEGFEDFCMDHLVIDAEIAMNYSSHTIFTGMEQLTRNKKRAFTIPVQQSFSYRKAGV